MTLMNAVLAIGGATVSAMILGALWYSGLLFGKIWMNYVGKTEKQIIEEGGAGSALVVSFIAHVFAMTILYYIVEKFVIVHTIYEAVTIALLIGALIFLSQVSHAAYNKVQVGLFLIDHSYDIAAVVLGALVMGIVTGA